MIRTWGLQFCLSLLQSSRYRLDILWPKLCLLESQPPILSFSSQNMIACLHLLTPATYTQTQNYKRCLSTPTRCQKIKIDLNFCWKVKKIKIKILHWVA